MTDKTYKIVALDMQTVNPGDLSWSALEELGDVQIYARTSENEVMDRMRDANILITNKINISEDRLKDLPHLQCICVTATGFNHIDTVATAKRDIPVCNVKGYSSESVAQHVFALLLELTNRVQKTNDSVQAGQWSESKDFSYSISPIIGLAGKTMGIFGFGQIGQRVAQIAQVFGMNIIAYHKHPERDKMEGVKFVDLETLFSDSDVITLHVPLNKQTEGCVNKELLYQMKKSAFLINTARGSIINEKDLRDVLSKNGIAGAGLDVLSVEPPPSDHPLYGLENCLITPHQAWTSVEARSLLVHQTTENVRAFINGSPVNVVNGVK